MSHYRNLGGGKRDSNEPEIMKRFAHFGWHCEQISGNRLWDLAVWTNGSRLTGLRMTVLMVDVKEPKGKVTPAQEKKWGELHAKGIPVYIARTEADVDAIMLGTARPWKPMTPRARRSATGPSDGSYREWLTVSHEAAIGAPRAKWRGMSVPDHGQHRTKPCGCLRSLGRCEHSGPYAPAGRVPGLEAEVMREMMKPPGEEDYDAALGRATKAAREAEATFAPPRHDVTCECRSCSTCIAGAP